MASSLVPETDAETLPQSAALRAYLEHLRGAGASASTLRAYRTDLTQLERWLTGQGVAVERADTAILRRYAAYLGTMRYAPATASRKLSAMRSAYAWMFSRGMTERDTAAVIPGPKRPRTLPATLSEREMGDLLDRPAAPGPAGLRDAALLELLYACGLRANEACTVRVADLDRREWMLRVLGKGGKQRLVPVGRTAAAALEAYLEHGRPRLAKGDAPELFLSVRGKPLHTSDVRRILARGLRDGSLPARSPHALRHTFATHLLEGG